MAEVSGLMGRVPGPARLLGLAGLIPFAAGALAVWVWPESTFPSAALAGYGAVILSFMGGCRWGLAAAGLGEGPAMRPLAISVIPSLYAWAVVFLWSPAPLLALAVGFAALLAADMALTREGGAPAWWPALRWPLTAGAVASLVIASFA